MEQDKTKRRIRLPLTPGHCMVCTAKARGRELAEKLMASGELMSAQEESEFEMLQRFVLETDFDRLIQQEPLLDGRSGVTLIIEEGRYGKLTFHAEHSKENEAGPTLLPMIHNCENHKETE